MFDDLPPNVLSPAIRKLAEKLHEAAAEWFEFGFTLNENEDGTWEAHLTLRTMLLPTAQPPLVNLQGVGYTANAAVTELAAGILTALHQAADSDIETARIELDSILRVIR